MKKFNQFREDSLLEVLKASDPTGKWISDFVHSDNPKFAGKSKKERIQMALGASYASKRNEEVVEKNNHWHDAGKQDAKNGKRPNPRTYLSTLKDKQAKHPEEVYFYMQGYKSVKQGVAEEASPMIKPPSNRFDNKKEAFTHAKTHGGKVFRSTYIDPNTGNKNITFVVKKEQGVAEANDQDHNIGDKVLINVANKWHPATITKPRNAAGNYGVKFKIGTKTHNYVSSPDQTKKQGVAEAKDSREYDYEGDMAKSQLRSIMANAQRVHDMLEDDTNMAEWVQSKITLAADYISTVADYMQSEVKEEVEELDELSKSTLAAYAKGASQSATIKRKIAADFENKSTRAKSPGMKAANAKLSQNYKEKSWKRQDNVNKAIDRLAKEEVEPIEELNKDTVYSYAKKAHKDQDNQSTAIGKGIRDNDPKSANKASHKFSMRATGLDRAETRLNKEDTEVAEARMSAAQRLWNAEQKQRAKSDASLARTPSSIPKPEEKK